MTRSRRRTRIERDNARSLGSDYAFSRDPQVAQQRAEARGQRRLAAVAPIIRAFVSNALKQHGPPRFTEVEWTRPQQVVAGKRVHRR